MHRECRFGAIGLVKIRGKYTFGAIGWVKMQGRCRFGAIGLVKMQGKCRFGAIGLAKTFSSSSPCLSVILLLSSRALLLLHPFISHLLSLISPRLLPLLLSSSSRLLPPSRLPLPSTPSLLSAFAGCTGNEKQYLRVPRLFLRFSSCILGFCFKTLQKSRP